MGACRLGRSFAWLLRWIRHPGQHHTHGKSYYQEQEQLPAYPDRDAHKVESAVNNLNNDKGEAAVKGRYPKDPPPAELVNEGR